MRQLYIDCEKNAKKNCNYLRFSTFVEDFIGNEVSQQSGAGSAILN